MRARCGFTSWTAPGNRYASGTITFAGTPEFGQVRPQITLGGQPDRSIMNLIGDTAESIAKCFELIDQRRVVGGVGARPKGATLTITARAMGVEGNGIAHRGGRQRRRSPRRRAATTLSGGARTATWRTDLAAAPRMNRAARDWSRSFFAALKGYGIDVAAAFSMELRHGDDSPAAGIAQRYRGRAVLAEHAGAADEFRAGKHGVLEAGLPATWRT